MAGAGEAPLLYVRGLVAYDGTDYHGFQVQRSAPSIQGALEEALAACARPQSRVVGAGRTDTGVHASGQVIAVRVGWGHEVEALQRAWNTHLPPAIGIRSLEPAPEGFHPRFSALSRMYRYTVCRPDRNGAAQRRSPLTDRYALFVAQALDVQAMQAAAELLVGEHDFATFGRSPQGESTVRRVMRAEWQEVEDGLPPFGPFPGRRLVFTIEANGFLQQMVRNLVGSLLEVGKGHWSVSDLSEALAARRRSRSAPPAPPQGLVLERVSYPAAPASERGSRQA